MFWPIDGQYYPDKISRFDQSTGLYNVSYGDCDNEKLNMGNETCRILQRHRADFSDLSTIHKEAIEFYLKTFAHK